MTLYGTDLDDSQALGESFQAIVLISFFTYKKQLKVQICAYVNADNPKIIFYIIIVLNKQILILYNITLRIQIKEF